MPKNILLTGASSGIGEAVASLLSENNGYNLYLTGRRSREGFEKKEAKLQKIKNFKIENYFSFDLANVSKIPDLIKEINCEIDILINCAGQYIYKPVEKMDFCEIDDLINLNFKACYVLSSLIVPVMRKNNWGRIINIGSISGIVGEANATLYSATKSALSGFTKALALETAQNNITVNQINPGWVETPLAESFLSEEEKQEVIDVTPQKRFVEPVEIAKLCEYLIKEEAKGITGQNINICAGLSIGC